MVRAERGASQAVGARWAAVAALTMATAAAPGCESYDPPPEMQLVIPSDGKWHPGAPLIFHLSEPIAPESLRFSIYPNERDIEGDLLPTAAPVVSDCSLATPCGAVVAALSEDGKALTLDLGDAFDERQGRPYFVEVAPGLQDLAGRKVRGHCRHQFQITPPTFEGTVEVPLQSGVLAMTSDLSDVLAGVYLRMYLDVGIAPEGGETWLMATVARMEGDFAPNASDPEGFVPRLNEQGWTVLIEGTMTPLGGGEFFLDTVPQDLHVKVLGIIDVQLNGFRLEATVTPGGDASGRDIAEGFLTASKGLLGDPSDPEDLGQVGVSLVAFGITADELPEGLPRLCVADPCATLVAGGGDCQLETPWTPGPACP